jgi:GTP-binding protein HflX
VWLTPSDGRLLAEIHAQGEVLEQRTEGDQLVLRARLPERLRGRLEQAGARITSAT